MDDELASFYKLEVWEYAKLSPKANLIKCKWIFVRKYDADGMLKKYKARLLLRDSVSNLELIFIGHLRQL